MEEAQAEDTAKAKEVKMHFDSMFMMMFVKSIVIMTVCLLVLLQKTMDEKTALELLSDDFGATEAAASCAAATKVEAPALESDPLKVGRKIKYKPPSNLLMTEHV